jgi:hypothetical protein
MPPRCWASATKRCFTKFASSVWIPAVDKEISSRNGKTRDISTRGVYFTIDQDLGAGAELDLTLTLPAEVTRGSEVFIRAMGKVVRVDKKPENGSSRVGVAAVIERYEIIRTESSAQ